jgi:hypothetical protein
MQTSRTRHTHRACIAVLFAAIASCAVLLSACGENPKAPSKANFTKAINAHFADPARCTSVDLPYRYSSDSPDTKTFRVPKTVADRWSWMAVLAKRGLFITKPYTERFGDGGLDYTITDQGLKWHRLATRQNLFMGEVKVPVLCIGHREVVGIDRFTEPTAVMGMTITQVRYRYRLADQPSWLPQIAELLPNLPVGDAIEADTTLVLTNNGWEWAD